VYGALQTIETGDSPFPNGTKVPELVSWVRPTLVAEVKYYDVTKTGQLIWPIFQRVRTDLTVEEVTNAG
jgi:bifunctional non-homologous end joining protein LigD